MGGEYDERTTHEQARPQASQPQEEQHERGKKPNA